MDSIVPIGIFLLILVMIYCQSSNRESFVQWPGKRTGVFLPIADNRYHHQEFQPLQNTTLFTRHFSPMTNFYMIPNIPSTFGMMRYNHGPLYLSDG